MSGNGIRRRDYFKIVGVGAGVGLLGGALSSQAFAGMRQGLKFSRSLSKSRDLDPNGGLSVITLGTGTPIPSLDRACSATLIIAGNRTVLVDFGRGALIRLAQAQLLKTDLLLFTHYHSDHISDFGELMVTRTVAGAKTPLPVIGPVGAKKVVNSMLDVFSMDKQYRITHHGAAFGSAGMEAPVTEAQPGVVYDKGGLKITMFEVDHRPVVPAVGYKFEYKGKSIVVSGDTIKVPKMIEMAQGADILVHEALNKKLLEIGANRMNARVKKMALDLHEYHTPHTEVAEIAKEANVKKLVLTHMVPSPFNAAMGMLFTRGMGKIFKGPIELSKDLDEFSTFFQSEEDFYHE